MDFHNRIRIYNMKSSGIYQATLNCLMMMAIKLLIMRSFSKCRTLLALKKKVRKKKTGIEKILKKRLYFERSKTFLVKSAHCQALKSSSNSDRFYKIEHWELLNRSKILLFLIFKRFYKTVMIIAIIINSIAMLFYNYDDNKNSPK